MGRMFYLFFLSLWLSACGLPQKQLEQTNAKKTPVIDRTVSFSVIAIDGFLRKAIIFLASIKKGAISEEVRSDMSGQAVLKVPVSTLKNLDSDDILYVFVSSDHDSSVQIDEISQAPLQTGQLGLKSYLGRAAGILGKTAFYDDLCSDQELEGNCIVSHFSTAKAVLLEQQMRSEYLLLDIVQPSHPQVAMTSFGSERILAYQDYFTEELNLPTSDLTRKFLLLAIVIKAQVELGQTKFLAEGVNYSLHEPWSIFSDVAANYELESAAAFIPIFPIVHNAVQADLQNAWHQKSFDSKQQAVDLSVLSGNEVLSSLQKPVVVEAPSEEDLSIKVGTKFYQQPFFRIRNRVTASDEPSFILQVQPSLPASGMAICLQEFYEAT